VADLEIAWGGLTIGTEGGPYIVEELSGWDDLPEVTSYDTPRSRGHGDHVGDQFARSRVVTVSGSIANRAARDALALALQTVTPVTSTVEDLSIETLGRSLTAGARLIRRALPVTENYASGLIPFALQWKCPDPLRYGPELSASTGLPSSSGGLAFPVTFPANFGATGDLGLITLPNDGTAATPVRFTVSGPLSGGFELSGDGGRIAYPVEVPAGQAVTIDTGRGSVLVEGTSDRRASLTAADWLQVPAGGSLTVQFTSLGAYDAAATLTAQWRPAYW
jgi:hypothetical protein